MSKFNAIFLSLLLSACVTVDTVEGDASTGIGILSDNDYHLAINTYNSGDFAQAEIEFKNLMNSDEYDFSFEDESVIYWLASAGRMNKIAEIESYLIANDVELVSVLNSNSLDLGFRVDVTANWKCFEIESNKATDSLQCWPNLGYVDRAKSLIRDGVISDYIASRIIE